jgi:mRNA interferase RelE/StbE
MALNKTWKLIFSARFEKKFYHLSQVEQQRIIDFFEIRVLKSSRPREYAKPLKGNLSGYWSFRIGKYRVIAEILDQELNIITFDVGHRREVYD